MANILSGLLGQSEIPDIQTPTGQDVLSAITAMIPQSTAATIDYNKRLAGPLTDVQLGVEKQYDPNAARLRAATSAKILQLLESGGQIPPDVMQAVGQASAERNGMTGVSGSPAARSYTARDFGLTSMDIMNQAVDRAANYARSGPSLNQLWTPQGFMDPETLGNLYTSGVGAANQKKGMEAAMRSQNNLNMIKVPVGLASYGIGTAAGAMFGTNSLGGVLNTGGTGGPSPSTLAFASGGRSFPSNITAGSFN